MDESDIVVLPPGEVLEPGDAAPVVAAGGSFLVLPTTTATQRYLAELGLLAVMACWALNFITVKGTGGEIPPMTFAAVRFSIAALVLLALLRWREGSIGIPRRDLAPLALLGVVGFGIYQMLWASAIQLISAGDSALLIAITPVLAALIAVAIRSDTLTAAKLAGALLSFAGVAVVVTPNGAGAGASQAVGYGVTLVAAICWALYAGFSPRILRHHSPLKVAAWVLAFGAITLVPAGLIAGVGLDWAKVAPLAWAGLAYSAVLAAGLSNIVMFEGIRVLGPARATAFQFLVPFFAILIGAMALGDPIRPAQIVGGVVIVAGVVLTRSGWSPFRRRPSPEVDHR